MSVNLHLTSERTRRCGFERPAQAVERDQQHRGANQHDDRDHYQGQAAQHGAVSSDPEISPPFNLKITPR
jgi:hypothetical protein